MLWHYYRWVAHILALDMYCALGDCNMIMTVQGITCRAGEKLRHIGTAAGKS